MSIIDVMEMARKREILLTSGGAYWRAMVCPAYYWKPSASQGDYGCAIWVEERKGADDRRWGRCR
jgi:hypothetical protein